LFASNTQVIIKHKTSILFSWFHQSCRSRGLHHCSPLLALKTRPDIGDQIEAFNQELDELLGSQQGTAAHAERDAAPNLAKKPSTATLPGQHSIPSLTHTDANGKASMVDVGGKDDSNRTATAAARVLLGPEAFPLVAANQVGKGDVMTVAQLAGIMGAKQTSNLIPLCHPLLLSHVDVSLRLDPSKQAVDVMATAATTGPTGVEMEAMTAAAVAALTVYDMTKAASKGIVIENVRLLRKTGGKSGTWER
jgi:cyclic pyranopterin monophosphate synthase